MLKALIRKQLLEIRSVYFTGKKGKDKKRKQVKNPKAMYILFGFLYLFCMFGVFGLCMLLSETLFPAGMDWMFFTIMSIFAFLLGIFGSVLSTANALFRSKDNELLLSMPIPPSRIVFVRMIAVYITGFIYECIVLVPAIICHIIYGNPTAASVILSILTLIIEGFLITAFSCAVGWIISLISAKMKNQKIIRVVLIVLLLGLVYYFQFNAQRIFTALANNAQAIAGSINGWGYPLYAAGLGMAGNFVAFLVYLAITAALFLLAYWAVSKSFASIALAKYSEKKGVFHTSDIKTRSVQDALFRRDMKKFFSSVAYMLNAGLGILLLVAGAVMLLIKMQDIRTMVDTTLSAIPNVHMLMIVAGTQMVCMLTSMCCIASCAISIEGKDIWLLQSMPVDPYNIFRSKISVHVVLAVIPALLCTLVMGITLNANFVEFLCMIIYVFMYIVLTAFFELAMDMRRPKLEWTNENQAVKNNITVFATTFAALLIPVAIGALYLLAMRLLGASLYLVIFIAIFVILTLVINKWLAGKGRVKFSTL